MNTWYQKINCFVFIAFFCFADGYQDEKAELVAFITHNATTTTTMKPTTTTKGNEGHDLLVLKKTVYCLQCLAFASPVICELTQKLMVAKSMLFSVI